MKKILLSITVSVLFITYSNAQFFSAGLKAGGQAAAAALSPDDGIEYSGIFGYHAGAFAKLKSPVKFGGKIEVLYSARGGDIITPAITSGPFQSPEITTEFRASYIDIPLMATFNFIKPLAIEVGPQFSFLTNGEFSDDNSKTDYEPDNSPEIGLAVGLDLNLPKKLGLYVRYNLSWNSQTQSSTDPNTNTTIETKTDVAQSWIQFGVKYRIVEPI
ncbi:PorT family protein [Hyphobacterium sp. CCMP332]|nr:PorT family protein [Hyphobacterium sp. CCMP332]